MLAAFAALTASAAAPAAAWPTATALRADLDLFGDGIVPFKFQYREVCGREEGGGGV